MSKTIFEHSSAGRKGATLPRREIDIPLQSIIPADQLREKQARLPEVSELDVMRHYIALSHKNHFIEKGLYPLGSCTMKYNPKVHEALVRDSGFNNLHPYQPEATIQGSLEILYELQEQLAEISGMSKVTLQPVAGAQGEFTGIKIIAAYHKAKGNHHKTKIIIPDSAHGTNPATCSLVGYEVVELKSNAQGRCDLEHLKSIVDDNTAGFMLTNPNTLGLFETQLEQIAEIIHGVDGLIYMDGANLNALLGIVQPGKIGFDVMHFNLHKTFATPHGGGGPGAGPVGVVEKLVPFLPVPMVAKAGEEYYFDYGHAETSIGKVHTFYGNFAVLLRAYIYIKMLGAKGIRQVAENALINANYLMALVKDHYHIQHLEYCMHEFVADSSWQKKEFGVNTLDIAKRLLDKGFHAPTIYFPLIVPEAMMIEPTETESKQSLDSFAAAMLEIAQEIRENPEMLHEAPLTTPVRRVDDVRAVKVLDPAFNLGD
ncbi:MAG TPA: aminomethyl-transferring glycine dehydrogenase subunit GcvPB [Candidatus Cloacimonadota bacterium]|jgi:glycine dehydrogenase subunit 2|nr:aminomethyl-transferring glycine dehydrogenase subunit GcvPB [Candidatus Cloacimonadota bacterium]HOF59128.1 aminomethyl-transferring glycine dehydrogenase subunit GcvPB [Candidatus Cloacimonadota bacterium]HOR58072.1 aminomethyl-transferring glycine dehydrogenase subunit GcvPB [Candidatus Cloacimonadota bacterium]HPB08208.1 aminomethyl-transferring glycine dehydrogenase subunit GcvPB [Candidatus Cloacimonadota bacterium]HPL22869.1 aminomethyl-transferring glycine dehydrogenase subunit GcvPB